MQKHFRPVAPSVVSEQWQKLQDDVEVELTSEDPERPIEGALLEDGSGGWRAGGPGRDGDESRWCDECHYCCLGRSCFEGTEYAPLVPQLSHV